MKVKKRNGILEEVSFDKVINRLKLLCTEPEYGNTLQLDVINIAQKDLPFCLPRNTVLETLTGFAGSNHGVQGLHQVRPDVFG